MAFFDWNDSYSVGVADIDTQHKKLFALINELYDSTNKGRANDVLERILGELIEYTKFHFKTEEQLLEQNGYPGLPEHRIAHRRLLSEIRRTVDRAEQSSHVAIGPLLVFLRDWYLNHIEGLDQQYGAWLNERGIF